MLSLIPGALGDKFETKRLFMIKERRFKKVSVLFDEALVHLGHDSAVIDLGANVGAYTKRLASAAGHVHAFEPDPWAYDRLVENVGHLKNVTTYKAAAGVRAGTASLRRVEGFKENMSSCSQGSTLQAFDDMFYALEPDEISVDVIDFVQFLEELDGNVDLIKMDIEGSEVDLLNHLLDSPVKNKVGKIFCETHEAQMPALRNSTAALRRRVAGVSKPYINLDWC